MKAFGHRKVGTGSGRRHTDAKVLPRGVPPVLPAVVENGSGTVGSLGPSFWGWKESYPEHFENLYCTEPGRPSVPVTLRLVFSTRRHPSYVNYRPGSGT